jgi:hypothetical protein
VSPRNYWHDLCTTSANCAHAFTLTAAGNTTNGYNYRSLGLLSRGDFCPDLADRRKRS